MGNIPNWVGWNLSQSRDSKLEGIRWSTIFRFVCYQVWHWRNDKVFSKNREALDISSKFEFIRRYIFMMPCYQNKFCYVLYTDNVILECICKVRISTLPPKKKSCPCLLQDGRLTKATLHDTRRATEIYSHDKVKKYLKTPFKSS